MALRYFNVFGLRQDPNSKYSAVIPKFIVGMIEGRKLTIHRNRTQSKDFTYVSNVVEANPLVVTAEAEVARALNVQANVVQGASRAGDVPYSLADTGLLRERLGYKPFVRAREGLWRPVESFQERY